MTELPRSTEDPEARACDPDLRIAWSGCYSTQPRAELLHSGWTAKVPFES